MQKLIDVAVAVFQQADGKFLLASRPAGKPYAGYWEFPGGKIEAGESIRDALTRELREELNVVIDTATPWFSFDMHYAHANVRLHTWRVTAWHDADARGMCGLEGQSFQWQALNQLTASPVSPVLPGCVPIFRALSLPTTYIITNAGEVGEKAYIEQIRAFWGKNASKRAPDNEFQYLIPHLIQVREKQLSADALQQFAQRLVAECKAHGVTVLINHDVQLAHDTNANGVHLTSLDLAKYSTRPNCDWVGASVHNRQELERAAELGCDFAILGAVNATQSHPGQATLGWEKFAAIVVNTPIPVFAIGGLTHADLSTAIAHGAHGIALQRAAFI
jgi:8-oxo-dGTP diphosphatase